MNKEELIDHLESINIELTDPESNFLLCKLMKEIGFVFYKDTELRLLSKSPDTKTYPFIKYTPHSGEFSGFTGDTSSPSLTASNVIGDIEKCLSGLPTALLDTERVFDTGSIRDSNQGKPRVGDMEPSTRLRFGYHMLLGANNYGAKNYLLGQPDESSFESIHRHLALLESGDSSEDHASALIFNIQLIMLNQSKDGLSVDHFYQKLKDVKKK